MTDIDNVIGERFEKAYPRREFANVQDVAAANIYKTPYVPKETLWNAQRTVTKPGGKKEISVTHVPESDEEEAKEMVDKKVDPRFATTAYQNMEEARRLDAEQNAKTGARVESMRYQPEYPYEMFVQPLNRIGARKPRETETAYFEEEPLDMTEDLETHGLWLRAPRAAQDAKNKLAGMKARPAREKYAEVYEFKESNTDIDSLIAGRFAKSPEYWIDSYKAANAEPKDLFVAGADAFDATSTENPMPKAAKEAFAPHLGMGKVVDSSYTPSDKVIVHTRNDPMRPYDKETNDRTSMITMPGARVLQRQRDDAQTDRFFGTKIGERKPVQTPAEQPAVMLDAEGNEMDEDLV